MAPSLTNKTVAQDRAVRQLRRQWHPYALAASAHGPPWLGCIVASQGQQTGCRN